MSVSPSFDRCGPPLPAKNLFGRDGDDASAALGRTSKKTSET